MLLLSPGLDEPLSPEPVVELFVDVEPVGLLVWFVPPVGLLFDDRSVELPGALLHGRPLRPVPDNDGLLSPGLLLPLGEGPGADEGLDPLLMPPLPDAPVVPPLTPPV